MTQVAPLIHPNILVLIHFFQQQKTLNDSSSSSKTSQTTNPVDLQTRTDSCCATIGITIDDTTPVGTSFDQQQIDAAFWDDFFLDTTSEVNTIPELNSHNESLNAASVSQSASDTNRRRKDPKEITMISLPQIPLALTLQATTRIN